MKTPYLTAAQKYRNAFTIPELLLALSIFLVCVFGIVSLQILGLKMNAISASKLKSTAASLKTLNIVRDHVLGANSVLVGNGDSNSFTVTGTIGNALQVYPTTNSSNYLRFYLSTDDNTLYELNNTNEALTAIAPNITNELVFQTVDFQGNTSSSSREHYAIKMTLQFSQLDYKVPKKTSEYYTLETEMTPRTQ
jgi:hypothetical protein